MGVEGQNHVDKAGPSSLRSKGGLLLPLSTPQILRGLAEVVARWLLRPFED